MPPRPWRRYPASGDREVAGVLGVALVDRGKLQGSVVQAVVVVVVDGVVVVGDFSYPSSAACSAKVATCAAVKHAGPGVPTQSAGLHSITSPLDKTCSWPAGSTTRKVPL